MSEPLPPTIPYKGLMPYSEDDAPFFFGRELEREIITANLMGSRLTLLYGASGVGKSSLLRAGVAHYLRRLARQNMAEEGTPEFVVVVFSSWRDDPVDGLLDSVRGSVALTLNGQAFASVSSRSLGRNLQSWAVAMRGDLLIILDQFEEYFLYHAQEDGEGTFAVELPRAVNQPDLRANFLISIREDSLAKLDRFKGRIPNLFDSYLRIEHLDREAARTAITNPLAQYNRLYATDGQPISIEPALVEAVLEQVKTGQLVLGEAGRGVVRDEAISSLTKARIETPYLQLVMTRLWKEEMDVGSHIIRLDTLNRLGGAERIVQTHLDDVMSALRSSEQDVAAGIFQYLVTPAGHKIAFPILDLAGGAGLEASQLTSLLQKLSHGGVNILRSVGPAAGQSAEQRSERYEIFHDVLAPAILDWRTRYLQAQKRAEAERLAAEEAAEREKEAVQQREKAQLEDLAQANAWIAELRGWLVVALIVAVGAISVAAWLLYQENQEAQRKGRLAQAGKLAAISRNSLETDPELSALLALQAVSEIHSVEPAVTPEVQDSLQQAVQALRRRPPLSLKLSWQTERGGRTFSADGRYLATTSGSVARVWEVSSGRDVAQISHEGQVTAAAFSADGRYLAATSGSVARVWEVSSGLDVAQISPRGRVTAIALSADGRDLATVSDRGTIRVYALNFEELIKLAWTKITRSLRLEECRKYWDDQPCPETAQALDSLIEGTKISRGGDIDSAIASFRQAQYHNRDLRFDPEVMARRLAADVLVAKGWSLARGGDIYSAIASFRQAQYHNRDLGFDPEVMARRLAADVLVAKALMFARGGDVDRTRLSFQHAEQLDPAIAVARQLAPDRLVEEGRKLALEGRIKDAIAAFTGAQFDPELHIKAVDWNTLCWNGSLYGYADDVMYACQRAVDLKPEDGGYRDSRGLARALSKDKDYAGAVEDFQFYVEWGRNKRPERELRKRQDRVRKLEEGRDPFDLATLKDLRNEKETSYILLRDHL